MPNLNPQDARTYNAAPTLWKYDPQTNILWLKLTDASNNTSWFPINLTGTPLQSTTPAQADFSTDSGASAERQAVLPLRRLAHCGPVERGAEDLIRG
jgi:hypothetical protein